MKAKIIIEYWKRRGFGEEMIKEYSESDLLFLIPNNEKRMLGLPITRVQGGNKKRQKHTRKRRIIHEHFGVLESHIAKLVEEQIREYINNLAEVYPTILRGEKNECNCSKGL